MKKVFSNTKLFFDNLVKLSKLFRFLKAYKGLLYLSIVSLPFIVFIEILTPLIIKRAIDDGVVGKNPQALIYNFLIYLLLVIGLYVVRIIQNLSSAVALNRSIRDLRVSLLNHLVFLPQRFFDHRLSGTLVSRSTSDFDRLASSLDSGVLTALVDVTVFFGSLIGLFILNARLAMFAVILTPLILVVVQVFANILKKYQTESSRQVAALNSYSQESLLGLQTVKVLNAEPKVEAHHRYLSEVYRKVSMKSVFADASLFSVVDGLTFITVGMALLFSVKLITGESLLIGLDETITAGVLVAFVQYTQQMFEPLKNLSNKIALLQGAVASVERIFELLDHKDPCKGDLILDDIKGNIQFKGVSFSYGNEPILKDISFEIEAGQSIAIVGRTGSGKSTLVKILVKLYEDYQGEIFLDSHSLRSVEPFQLRKKIGFVPQDISLFQGTVFFNITLGNPAITMQEVIESCDLLGITGFIQSLPNGFETILSGLDGGLSLGQRQLISFARALVKKPGLLILDEATASIDPESEALIQKAIATLVKNQTSIIIAHRMTTIENADKILEFENGRLINLTKNVRR